jgi:alpha-beta hydrolase superfamily lysophospholipase
MTTTRRFVSIWNPGELKNGESTPSAANALLFLPDGWSLGDGGPAAIFIPRWAGYHFDPTPMRMGPIMAENGVVFLSLGLRRRGGEGQIESAPDDDVEDLARAMDYLTNLGRSPIFLLGEGIGAPSAGRYASKSQDPRIGGLAAIAPGHSMGWSLARGIGQERYDAYLDDAREAVRRGAGRHVVVDVQRGPRANTIIQHAQSWIDWWGPTAGTDLSLYVRNVGVPFFVLGADEAWEKQLKEAALYSSEVKTVPNKEIGEVSSLLIDWIRSHSPAPAAPPAEMETFSVQSAEDTTLWGFFWKQTGDPGTALLYVHDAEDVPGSALSVGLANALTGKGIAVLAPMLRRTGRAGHLVATPEKDAEDIALYVRELTNRGYERMVLCGHRFGAAAVASYAAKEDSGIAGIVLLASIADAPGWAERTLGPERYRDVAVRAGKAVEDGAGGSLLIEEPYRDDAHRPGRFFQRAASWLASWGPESTRLGDVLPLAKAPVLIIDARKRGGSRSAPPGAEVIDANGRFEGHEDEVADRIAAWVGGLR